MVVILAGCDRTPKELSPEKYVSWIASEERGFIKSKTINNLQLTARYLPPDYLAFREYSSVSDTVSYDSVLSSYKCGTAFQITLQADKSDRAYGNIMAYNVASQEEFMARTRFLSFGIEEFIYLKHKDQTLRPVLSQFEGYDELGNKLNFQVVFILPEYGCGNVKPELDDMQLTFEDPLWDTGTNYFLFRRSVFADIPRLKP